MIVYFKQPQFPTLSKRVCAPYGAPFFFSAIIGGLGTIDVIPNCFYTIRIDYRRKPVMTTKSSFENRLVFLPRAYQEIPYAQITTAFGAVLMGKKGRTTCQVQRISSWYVRLLSIFQDYVDPRNIPPSVIEDAINSTAATPGRRTGTFVHQTVEVTVVVNSSGKVIAVIPR